MDTALQLRIRTALRQISANDLQVLAEDMACIKFPARFRTGTLVRHGRNDEAQTRKGWPDAFVPTGSNTVDGIEATRDRQSWSEHLADDLGKAKDPKQFNLSGYFFVGGYPDHSPSARQIGEWTDALARLGIPPEAITLLVGGDLVAELAAPEYARIRQTILGIPSTPNWFTLMGDVAITDRQLGPFQPTRVEFSEGRVKGPPLLQRVLTQLDEEGCAVVRGYGAAGKTTLAELISRSPSFSPYPSWYADLAKTEPVSASALEKDLVELAAPGVLFVLDNIHLDGALAEEVVTYWRRHVWPLKARFLPLGRDIRSGQATHIGAIAPLMLRAGINEMVSVVNRLYRRRNANLPHLSPAILSAWAQTFGGSSDPEQTPVDLIAFTAAVDRRLDDFLRGDFRLGPGDAVDAVRARYLHPLQESPERKNLMRLASMAAFEIGLHDELLQEKGDHPGENISIQRFAVAFRARRRSAVYLAEVTIPGP